MNLTEIIKSYRSLPHIEFSEEESDEYDEMNHAAE